MNKWSKFLFLSAGLCLLGLVVIRFIVGVWIPFLWILIGVGVGSILATLWLDRAMYREFLGMKTTRQGMSMGAMIGLVLILLIAVNFIAVRKYKTFDFSMAKVNTLSDQSIKLVKDLKEDLTVIYFYKNGVENLDTNRRAFIELIKKYQDQSDHVKLEFVELNEHPDLAEKYNVHAGTQMVILDFQGRQSRIEKVDEQELTSGLVKVTRTSNKKIYIMSGHGELPVPSSKDGFSIAMLNDLLTASRYTLADFSFTRTSDVPADADMLIVAGPKMAFLDSEVQALETYLDHGGSLILALSTGMKVGLDPLLKKMGILVQNNYVVSIKKTEQGLAIDPRVTIGSVFSPSHPITKPFGGNQFTVFRLPTALKKMDVLPSGFTVDDLVKTNDSVMAFKDTKFDRAGEQGAVTLGLAVKGKWSGQATKDFNALVFGDANFLNDQYLYQNLNRDLLLNSVAFLAKEENLISISPKEVEATQMNLSETELGLFYLGFVIPFPLLLFGGGGWLWYRRRYS